MPEPEINPYESPACEDDPQEQGSHWVQTDGRRVRVHPKATLPARCYYCNEPTTESSHVSEALWMSWGGIVSIKVRYFVCSMHRQQMLQHRTLYFAYLAAVALLVGPAFLRAWVPWVGWVYDNYFYVILAVVVGARFLASYGPFAKGVSRPMPPRIVAANPHRVLLSNAGTPFLESLEHEEADLAAVEG